MIINSKTGTHQFMLAIPSFTPVNEHWHLDLSTGLRQVMWFTNIAIEWSPMIHNSTAICRLSMNYTNMNYSLNINLRYVRLKSINLKLSNIWMGNSSASVSALGISLHQCGTNQSSMALTWLVYIKYWGLTKTGREYEHRFSSAPTWVICIT